MLAPSYKSKSEDVITVLRDHWVVLGYPILYVCVFIVIMAGLYYVSIMFADVVPLLSELVLLFLIVTSVVVMHGLFIFLIQWLLSGVFVTTKRIIEFKLTPYVKNDVSFIDIDEIHEIEKVKHGIWAHILDYGDVTINVAALPVPLLLRLVPNPTKFVHVVQIIRRGRLHSDIALEVFVESYHKKILSFL